MKPSGPQEMSMPDTYSLHSPTILTIATLSAFLYCSTWAVGQDGPSRSLQRRVTACHSIGEVTFPTGYAFEGTEVGGLSAIAYDAEQALYLALSDDRSKRAPARFYNIRIDLSDGHLDSGDIQFTDVTRLRPRAGSYFPSGGIDPEGMVLTSNGKIFIASEGDASKSLAPFVNRFDRLGVQEMQLPIDAKYLPRSETGIRNNLAFESLTLSPDERHLYTAVENALLQDGPKATLQDKSPSRILEFDLESGQAVREMVYEVQPVAETPALGIGLATNGLAELLALDDSGTFLALERSYSSGKGTRVKLYQILSQDAEDVSDRARLGEKGESDRPLYRPVRKQELLDFGDLVDMVDNLEGMTLGPVLPDGSQSLILVSDNNFSPAQFTQFIALALRIETIHPDERH